MDYHYLSQHKALIAIAVICALILSFTTSTLGLALGPILVSLLNSGGVSNNSVNFLTDALGFRLSSILDSIGLSTAGVTQEQVFSNLWWFLIALALVKFAVSSLQWLVWEFMGETSAYQLRTSLLGKYVHSNMERTDLSSDPKRKEVNESISILIGTDCKMYRDFLVRYYGGVPRDIVTSVILIATLVLISPKLSFTLFFAILPFLALINKFGKRIRQRTDAALRNFDQLSEGIQKRLLGIETIKHLHTEDLEIARISKINADSELNFLRAARVKARVSPVVELGGGLAVCGVLYLMLNSIVGGEISAGQQMSFLATAGLLSQSVGHLSKHFSSLREVSPAKARLVEFSKSLDSFSRDCRWVKVESSASKTSPVQLTVKDIKLSFAGASDKKFNFTCFGGHIYSVVGKSGAGKSTLLNIVMGIQAPRSGEVHYQHSRGSALEQVKSVFVSQDLHNMPLSVAEYVAYPDHEISSERIRSALREACVLDWVDQLTGGVDERLSFNESNLSGGQMQRLQIARVFYHRPDFIFLDEATSALDQVNEQKLLQNLRKLVSQTQAIVIMVAHRIQAIESADFKIEV